MSTSRPPGGQAGGTLAGPWGNPAVGLPGLWGVNFHDEFIVPPRSPVFGDQRWALTNTGAVTVQGVTPTNAADQHEVGVYRMFANSNNRFAALHQGFTGIRPNDTLPPVGSIFACKMRNYLSDLNIILWSGFASTVSVSPDAALGNTIDFVGVRYDAGGSASTWTGVVRNNSTESTEDLLVGGGTTDNDYFVIGFERQADGFQFFRYDMEYGVAGADDRRKVPTRIDVGTPVTTNFPDQPLTPVFGFETTAAGTRGLYIDWWTWGGSMRR